MHTSSPSPSPVPVEATVPAGTFLAPEDPFPSALAELELVELQVLHSRVCRRLEQEYLADPDGPHPVTRDRCQELVAELDTRQEFLTPPEQTPPASAEDRRGPAAGPAEVADGVGEPTEDLAQLRPGDRIEDLAQLRPGDPIEVWQHGQRQCRGTVEQVCPALGVLWVHEAGDGYRRMLHAQDAELRHHASSGVR